MNYFIGICIVLFSYRRNNSDIIIRESTVNDEKYVYEIKYYESSGQIIEAGGDAYLINILDLERDNDAYQIIDIIDNYAKEHNGTCEVEIVNSENNT